MYVLLERQTHLQINNNKKKYITMCFIIIIYSITKYLVTLVYCVSVRYETKAGTKILLCL